VWSYTPAPANAISVASFGAKGDGVTDDAAALNAAVSAISPGTNLSFESGKMYAISRSIQIMAKTQFNIYGQDAKIKAVKAYNDGSGTPTGGGPLNFVQCVSFSLSDLTVDGNRQERIPGQSGPVNETWVNNNFYLLTCTDFTINRLRSNNALCDGVLVEAITRPLDAPDNLNFRSKNGKFIDCTMDNDYRNGISFCYAVNMQVIGGFLTNANGTSPEAGCDVEPDLLTSPGTDNILFKGVSFVGNRQAGLLLPSYGYSTNITADGCYFSKNGSWGIAQWCTNVTIKNNVFYGQDPGAGGGAIIVLPPSNNCVITGNTIANSKTANNCILLEVSTATVTNNKIYDFIGNAISPASYNTGNDIQKTKIIADPGVPSRNVISINSSPSVAVPTGGKFGYKVKYMNLTNVPTVTVNWLRKPSWVNLYPPDSVYGTAPASPGTDSMKVVVSAGTSSDTLVVTITIAYYKALEAETGTFVAPMAVMADPSASGGSCISASTGINTITKKIEASYPVANMPAGTYYVWLKMSIPTGSTSNNFGIFVGFGSALNANYLKPKVTDAYTWVRSSVSFTLPAGTNTFILGHGLAGAKIDQIVITTSWEAGLPVNYTSIQEEKIQNQKINSSGPSIVPQPMSGGRINFVVKGMGAGDFTMDIFSVTGSRVWSYQQKSATAPDYQVIWDGTDGQLKPVRNGIYVAKIKAKSFSKQRLVLLNR
jgi:hypothetical protein